MTDRFEVAGGFLTADVDLGSADGQFQLVLKNPDDSADDRIVTVNDNVAEYHWGTGMPEGEFVFEVTAEVSWTITARQPRLTSDGAEDLPVERDGDASGGHFPVNLQDPTTVTASHEGTRRFIVTSYDPSGNLHPTREYSRKARTSRGTRRSSTRVRRGSWSLPPGRGNWRCPPERDGTGGGRT